MWRKVAKEGEINHTSAIMTAKILRGGGGDTTKHTQRASRFRTRCLTMRETPSETVCGNWIQLHSILIQSIFQSSQCKIQYITQNHSMKIIFLSAFCQHETKMTASSAIVIYHLDLFCLHKHSYATAMRPFAFPECCTPELRGFFLGGGGGTNNG